MKNTPKIDRKYGKIFGISLNSTEVDEVLTYVEYRIKAGKETSIVTPNPEIILASSRDLKLHKSISSADLALADGIGLAQASRFLSLRAPKNKFFKVLTCLLQGLAVGAATFVNKKWLTDSLKILPGRKIFLDLIRLANKNSWKVYLLGGENGVSRKVAEKLGRKYKKIKWSFADGARLNKEGVPDTEVDRLIQKRSLENINKFKPQLLFIALGPTKQEKWLMDNLSKLNVGGAVTVGGTFNYVAGASKLPPKKIEEIGLEWAWRLLTEPWRVGRIINAVIIFPWKVFVSKLRQS